MEDCYDVEAIALNVVIEGEGDVQINSIDLNPTNTPWQGTYYSGIPIEIEAIPYELVNFYWEIIDGDAVIDNVKTILQGSNSSWENLIDITVFLTNMKNDFKKFNQIYNLYFKESHACRTTIEVNALPTDIAIEFKCIALINK